MQSADVVLSMLTQRSIQNSDFVFDRLYRNLFNPDLFRLAYTTITAQLQVTPSSVDVCPFPVDGMQDTIARLRRETYHPDSTRLRTVPTCPVPVYGSQGTPGPRRSAQPRLLLDSDMLVQEAVYLVLQAIYEPLFANSSHGFRPGRGCHSALTRIRMNGSETTWIVEGDINTFFANISHSKLRMLLSRKICDGRFLNLIDMIQHAEYLQAQVPADVQSPRLACPFREIRGSSSAPFDAEHCGLVSSLLANIYLHELDLFMERYCSHVAGDVHYTRYATRFLATIAGSKLDAERVRNAIRQFLSQELAIALRADELRLISLVDQRVRFLDYEIARHVEGRARGVPVVSLQLLVPRDVVQTLLKPFVSGGKAIHHRARVNLPLPELLRLYNAEISDLYDYYCLADDVRAKLGKFRYYHYYSLIKTVALKEKCSVRQVLRRYGVPVNIKQSADTHKIFGLSCETAEGIQTVTYFNASLRSLREYTHR